MTWDQQKKKRKGQGPPEGGSGLDLKDIQVPDTSKTKSKIEEALKKDAESNKKRDKARRKTFFDQEADGCCLQR